LSAASPGGEIRIRRALISAWRKPEAVELAQALVQLGVSVSASGGTADAIAAAGLPVDRLSATTGFDNLLGGRVKTLHPAIHAAILARRDDQSDMEQLRQGGIEPIDMVAVDLYPFPTIAQSVGAALEIELIDIGGVALVRAAAKNYAHVTILSHAGQFPGMAKELLANGGKTNLDDRRRLAGEAFAFTAHYDAAIANRFQASGGEMTLPESLDIDLTRREVLRYGENPHQPGGWFVPLSGRPVGIAAGRQLGGKELSFTNFLDLDIALRLPREFSAPAATILKHTTPCGVGLGATTAEAFRNARSTDPQSAFGGIVGLNRPVDAETAEAIREGFIEVVTAPGFDDPALLILRKSKNMRLFACDEAQFAERLDFRSLWGGVLVQQPDTGFPEFKDLRVVTHRQPEAAELEALKFAWIAVRYVKSNAIVIADGRRTIGIGAGQMSRVDAAHIAVWKAGQAGLATAGTVAGSDAFFPFRDGLDLLADAGVTAVIQPGGSVRDEEVIAAADERGLAMVFTGRRHFRH